MAQRELGQILVVQIDCPDLQLFLRVQRRRVVGLLSSYRPRLVENYVYLIAHLPHCLGSLSASIFVMFFAANVVDVTVPGI